MDLNLTDRVIVITGAGSGLGRAVALQFASEGACVVAADIDDAAVADTAARIRAEDGHAISVRCDVAADESVTELFAHVRRVYGHVDSVVNNAAATGLCNTDDRPVHELVESVWDRQLNVTLKGTYLVSKAALPFMLSAKRGVIVNVSSADAILAEPGFDSYTAAKGGVEALTRSMAAHYGQFNIRVVAVRPGYILTECQQDWVSGDPAAAEAAGALHALGRMATPEEVANMVVFLASDRCSFVTGSIVSVDGGYSCFKDARASEYCRATDNERPGDE